MERGGVPRPVRLAVQVSGACLAAQVMLTDHGSGDPAQRAFWLLVGGSLLWLVARRRSRWARAVVVVTSFLGALVYAVATVTPSARAGVLAVLFVGQAVPLLAAPVRAHVGSQGGGRGSTASTASSRHAPQVG